MRKDLLDKDIVDHALSVLNRINKADPETISALINNRVICNEKLAKDSTVQCGSKEPDVYTVGLLGIINGILGADPETKYGPVEAVMDDAGNLLKFGHSEKCELR